MIIDLNIENFAIIDRLNIGFEEGLNIITGETGTGKSILADAINLLLGERADKSLVRHGYEKARVEAAFQAKSSERTFEVLKSYGIDHEKDGILLISREIHINGRSIARINGRIVTLTMIKEVVSGLLDVQSQNENQKLLLPAQQLEAIDKLCGEATQDARIELKEKYDEFKVLDKKIEQLSGNEMEKERKIDLLKFQIEEIESADLSLGEEESLLDEYKKLSAKEEIKLSVDKASVELSENQYGNVGLLERLYQLHTGFGKVEEYDSKLKHFSDEILTVYYQLEELNREIADYGSGLEYSERDIGEVERRIDLLNNLKRKYGSTIDEILSYRDEILDQLGLLYNLDQEIADLGQRKKELEESLEILSKKLSDARKNQARKFEKKIIGELKALNMEDSMFEVGFTRKDGFGETGFDKIEFMISANPGQPLKPISKVVSGGELSRVMLAFKNILAEKDETATLIFDEIDAGISGRTAQLVGEKIRAVSKLHQIICITHLPQIAAMANTHFRITKKTNKNLTTAQVQKLNYEEKIDEITRLIGGASLTETTRKHAAEMLKLSSELK